MAGVKGKALALIGQLNELMKCHDLQRILDLARPLFGSPLILSNATYRVMAITAEEDIADPRWTDIVEAGSIPMGIITDQRINSAYRRSLEGNCPVLDLPAEGEVGSVPMLRMTLATGDSILGYLDSPGYLHTHSEDDMQVFEFLGNLLAVELQRARSCSTVPENMLDYFVYDLLEGKLTDPKLIAERFAYFKWDIRSKGKVQVVSIRGKSGILLPDNTRFRRLVGELTGAFPQFKTFIYGTEVKLLCPVKETVRNDERFLADLWSILQAENLVAGVSRPLVNVTDIADFNRQAVRAADLGRHLHPERLVYYYDDFAIYHALELAVKTENLMQFCHSAVTMLRDYDLEHDTELLDSLRVYLTHNRSVGESAGALYIHRNTMNYRIAKINELTHLDMNNSDVFCHLLFSLYAMNYRKMVLNAPPDGDRQE